MHKIKIKPYLAKSNILNKYTKLIDKNRYYSNFGPLYTQSKRKIEKDLSLMKNGVILTSSGHSSILACCNFIKSISKKKIIITTSFNFFSSPQAIIQSGFEPYFVDIELESFSINFNNLINAIKINKNNLAGIIITSPFGYPININKLNQIQSKYDLPIIYDAADTFLNFNKYLDKSKIMICCSFHPTKTFPSNESGLIICPQKKIKSLKGSISFGYTGVNREATLVGFNGKFSEYDAAIFLANYEKKKYIKKKLLNNLDFINKHLKKLNKKNLFLQKNLGKSWVSSKICFYSKDKTISFLTKKFNKFGIGIYSAWNRKPIHFHKLFKKYKKDKLVNTLKIYNHFFTIPLNIDAKKSDLQNIIRAIDAIF